VGLKAGLDGCGRSRPSTGIRSPDRPPLGESLYRLSCPGPPVYMYIYICVCVCIGCCSEDGGDWSKHVGTMLILFCCTLYNAVTCIGFSVINKSIKVFF